VFPEKGGALLLRNYYTSVPENSISIKERSVEYLEIEAEIAGG
jgi:hypothetical protein